MGASIAPKMASKVHPDDPPSIGLNATYANTDLADSPRDLPTVRGKGRRFSSSQTMTSEEQAEIVPPWFRSRASPAVDLALQSVGRVSELLRKVKLDALVEKFADEKVDLHTLVKMDNHDYAQLGVKLGDREKLKEQGKLAHSLVFLQHKRWFKGEDCTVDYSTVPLTPSKVKDIDKREKCFDKDEIDADELWVDVSVEVIHLGKADTAEGSASLQLQLVYYWTDVRFVKWPEAELNLPENTWGPECRLKDDRSPPDISDVTFCVFNRDTGRMKRCVKYNIDMNWKLDPVRLMDFPFDVQDLTVWFRGASDYRTSAPGDFTGSSAGKHQYRLREARKHNNHNGKSHCGSDFLKVTPTSTFWD